MKEEKKKFSYQKWIDSVSRNYNEAVAIWAERIIKRECNPILYWLLTHTKNKYIAKLAGFEIRQNMPSYANGFSRQIEMWQRGKFIENFKN